MEALHLHVHLADAAELIGERGVTDVVVAGVGEHDEVRGHLRPVLLEEAAQVPRVDLLLALDDELHVERERPGHPQVRADGGHVGHDPALVVGGAPAVETAVALGGLEGGREPLLRAAGGHHVVMPVEARPAGLASPRTRRDARRGSPAPRRAPRPRRGAPSPPPARSGAPPQGENWRRRCWGCGRGPPASASSGRAARPGRPALPARYRSPPCSRSHHGAELRAVSLEPVEEDAHEPDQARGWRSSFDPLDVAQVTFDEIKAAPNTGWAPRGGRARAGRTAARP